MMAGTIGMEVFNRKCIIYRLTFQGITKRTSKRNYQPTWRTGNSRGLQSQVVIKRKQLSQGVHDMLSPTPQNIEQFQLMEFGEKKKNWRSSKVTLTQFSVSPKTDNQIFMQERSSLYLRGRSVLISEGKEMLKIILINRPC